MRLSWGAFIWMLLLSENMCVMNERGIYLQPNILWKIMDVIQVLGVRTSGWQICIGL